MARSRLTWSWLCSAWLEAPAARAPLPKWCGFHPVHWWRTQRRSQRCGSGGRRTRKAATSPRTGPATLGGPRGGYGSPTPSMWRPRSLPAGAVVAHSGTLMALAWALGVPHVALGPEESAPSAFAAWTGDASALAADPGEIVATIPNIFARTGKPPGFKRLEATLDQALDESAETLKKVAADASTNGQRRERCGPRCGSEAPRAPGRQ